MVGGGAISDVGSIKMKSVYSLVRDRVRYPTHDRIDTLYRSGVPHLVWERLRREVVDEIRRQVWIVFYEID